MDMKPFAAIFVLLALASSQPAELWHSVLEFLYRMADLISKTF